MNLLKTIKAEYLIELYKDNVNNLITEDLIVYAIDKVDSNFNEYIKSHPLEEAIKLAGLHYFIAIYLLISSGSKNDLNKDFIKQLVSEKNKIEDLHKSLLNFDFYLGSCGVEAQNLAVSKNEN